MGFWKRLKDWVLPPEEATPPPTPTPVRQAAGPEPPTSTPEPAAEPSGEEAQQLAQIKALLESYDLSNHELAAMFMLGLNTTWDAEMCALVTDSADKLTFWGNQEDNEAFLKHVVHLRIGPRFFGQYNEIAAFAAVLPRFVHLRSLRWEAKHYWNQHPILAAASELPQLEHLHIEESKMNYLPEYIAQATQLKALSLKGNKLTELPEGLELLTQLETLDLSDNQFKACPRAVYQLKRLETLRLHNNPLDEIKPRFLGRLYRLRDLQLPESVAKYHYDTLKDWLPDVDFDQPYWHFDDE